MRPYFLTPLIVATALFMENLDSTVIATSLPAIALDLHRDPISLKLALTSYLLSLAVFIPASGWAADRFGARTVFRSAIIIFTTGSILCGLSSTLTQFVLARIVQGFGGAMMVPVGRLVILRAVPRSQLVSAMAYLTFPALIGPVIGPPLGGFITTYFQWRWIFWINVPIGVLGMVLASLFIENIREEEPRSLDLVGFLLSGIGLSAVMFGMTVAGRGFISVPLDIALVALGGVLLTIYVWHARRIEHPILDLRLFKHPTFRISVTGGFLFRLGIGASPFLLPLMFQIGFGMTPFQSGSLTFASAAGAMLMKATAGPILKRIGFRTVLVMNSMICAVFLASYSLFTRQTSPTAILFLLLAGGFFRSLEFTSINTLTYAEISDQEASLATSFSAVVQQLSVSAGVAMGAAVIEIVQQVYGETTLSTHDFAIAFLVVAAISGSSVFLFRQLPADAGAELAGRTKGALAPKVT
ncbi:MAG: DHA2 family efflux MFS transporter permease subunit [Hyphomicrobiales bacterium]|nr:DHA2 family efflux MFS transporter permease subunit [Hyphomicrobiales bacterium]MDE2115884.1 DHA2 family efflux MFS transporter permease subunit [Hyphomicrobiales bacterium]